MTLIIAFVLFVALCFLGAAYGTDSRFDRPGRQF
jgi:TRAP-type C4-dicarboxylate transport system permease small subunit